MVARLRAVLLPFKSRNAARFKGTQTRGGGRCAARRLRAIRRSRPGGVFPTLIFLYDFRMWRSLACVVIIAVLAVVHANAQESPAQFYSGKFVVSAVVQKDVRVQ